MFSRFLDYIRKGDEEEENNRNGNQGKEGGKRPMISEATIEDSSSSTTAPTKRRVREDYRIKYAYLDYVNMIDMRGLESLTDDVRSSLEILRNSYLAIVNSLVILNERRRKRLQQEQSSSASMAKTNREASGQVGCVSSNFIDKKVAENFRNSADQERLSSYPDTYEWSVDKFCDPATRELEFKRLFDESEHYIRTVERIKAQKESINMARFGVLVRQGKSLLGITEMLNNNYSNNFLDIFRIC